MAKTYQLVECFVTSTHEGSRSYEIEFEDTGKQLRRNHPYLKPKDFDIHQKHQRFQQSNVAHSGGVDVTVEPVNNKNLILLELRQPVAD